MNCNEHINICCVNQHASNAHCTLTLQELFFFLSPSLIFNWKINILQYCNDFCHISTRISHRLTHVLSLIKLLLKAPSLFPPHPTPLDCHRALALGSWDHTAKFHWLSILHAVMYMFQYHFLKSSHPLSPLL